MRISANGLHFLEQQEGKENCVYKDSAGLPSVGVGHLIKAGECFDKPLTNAEVDALLLKDLIPVEIAIHKYVTAPLTQNQYDALCSFIFNVGVNGFIKSSVLRFTNEKHYHDATEAFLLWNKETIKGVKVASKGLTARRKREMELFLK